MSDAIAQISEQLTRELQRPMAQPERIPQHDKTKLLLIDLSHLWWSSWHATADAEVSEAFHKTLDRVDWVQREVDHDLCAICCDAAPYWRSELNPEYKSNRQAASPMALEQFQRVRDKLHARGELLWRVQGFEADDIIAHATRIAVERGMAVTIATNDKDLLQLVSDDVLVLSTQSGDILGPSEVLEKMGVAPRFVAQQLALSGDKSDNIVGIPRVGLKTAASLIHQFGDANDAIQAARANDESITQALRKALADNWENYGRALAQIELTRDVPGLDFDTLFQARSPANETKAEDWSDELNGDGEDMAAEDQATKQEQKPEPTAKTLPKKAPEQSAALVKLPDNSNWELQLEPRNASEAWNICKHLAESRLYVNLKSADAIFAVVLRGRALGIDATTALASFHVIEGKPAMHADLIEALVLRSPKCEYFECVETTSQRAIYETKKKGGRYAQREEFTIEDAWRAGLVVKSDAEGAEDGYIGVGREGPTAKSNWSKWRKTMLRHRAKTQLARRVYSDIVLGLYTADELSNGDVVEAEFVE